MTSQCTLSITGMHCASCSALITHKLTKTKGVEKASVNLASAKAHVHYDPAQVDEQGLIAAVKSAGYNAEVRHDHGHLGSELDRKRQEAEIRDYRTKFLIGLVLCLPMLGFMVLMLLPKQTMPPALSAVEGYMGIVSLILATPVQFWLGKGFFKGDRKSVV